MCLCVRVCVEHVYRQRQLAGVSSLCTPSWVWTSILRLGHKSLNSQPLAGSDFGCWKVLTWLLRPVIWFVQRMFILVRICNGLMLNGRCFLKLWVSLTTCALVRTSSCSLFSLPASHCSVTMRCLLRTAVASSGLNSRYQPPSALPYQSPRPVSVS